MTILCFLTFCINKLQLKQFLQFCTYLLNMKHSLLFVLFLLALFFSPGAYAETDEADLSTKELEKLIKGEFHGILENFFLFVDEIITNVSQRHELITKLPPPVTTLTAGNRTE